MSFHKKNHRVIINADDFGITKGVNKAIFELADAGVVTSTTVMLNMPHCKNIIELKNKIGIGIHLNLTDDKPITEPKLIPTLVNKRGSFFSPSELLKRVQGGQISKGEVEIELNAQIKRLIDMGIQPDHVDSHESLIKYPFFMGIIKKVAKKNKIMAVRTYSPRKFDFTRLMNSKKIIISLYLAFQKLRWKLDGFRVADKYDSLIKFGLSYNCAIKKLKEIFLNLPDGVLEIGVHPGYCDDNDILLGGYVKEREVELQSLMSDEFKHILKISGTRLITFSDIGK